MSVWTSIGGGICVAVTVVGLVLSVLLWRKRGATRGMRGIAWSLLPLVAYLTGAVRLLGRIIDAIVRFAGTFVFSPKSWAGVIVLGVVVVLFLVSGGLPLLNWRKARRRRKVAAEDREAAAVGASGGHGRSRESAPAVSPTAQTQTGTAPVPRGSADDDDMGDIQE